MKNKNILPEILHKSSADDVLICRPRRAFPLFISESESIITEENHLPQVLENYLTYEGKKRKFNLSKTDHIKCNVGSSFSDRDCVSEKWDKVRGIPYQIVNQSIVENKNDDKCGQIYPESVVAKIFDSMPSIQYASSFEFINKADNYFFYRKAHEHVPGTMFIEAARQAVYHHLYTQEDCVRGEVTVTLDELNAKFFAYAELMYPIELIVDVLQHPEKGRQDKIFYRVSFYQKGNLFSVVDTKANIINIDLFKKIRNIFLYSDDWYSPINTPRLNCELISKNGDKIRSELFGISKHGCITSIPYSDCDNIFAINVAYGNSLIFKSNVKLEEKNNEALVFCFDMLSSDDLYNLGDIIKRVFIKMDKHTLKGIEINYAMS